MASSEVEFLEERLTLLETWLESTKDDDDNNEDLIQKREEYRGLIDETILLQKKLRKTSKLLSTESSEKTLQKLTKKQDQYLCEIEEIMNYAESDVLFETAEIEPNELLGEPLETLMEQPGLEGSSSSELNFSMSDFMPKASKASQSSISSELLTVEDLHPIAENTDTSSYIKHGESMASIGTGMATLFTISTANSNTYNYDEKTLRKKLKKVDKLLAAEEVKNNIGEVSPLDAREMKKLRKKREQYTEALQYKIGNGRSSSRNRSPVSASEDNVVINLGVEVQSQEDVEEESIGRIEEESEEYEEEKIEEYEEEEIEEYEEEECKELNTLQCHDSSVNNSRNHDCHDIVSYDRKTLKKKLKKVKKLIAATSDAKELELLKQKKKEYKMTLETLKEQEIGVEKSSPSRHSQHALLEVEKVALIEGEDVCLSPAYSIDSDMRDDVVPSEEIKEQIEFLQKKLRKAEKSIAKARIEDEPKKLKKIEKKRREYQAALVELLGDR
jgi:hypothetical protein